MVWLWLTNLGSLQWSNLVKASNLINKFKTLGKHKREEIFLNNKKNANVILQADKSISTFEFICHQSTFLNRLNILMML